jgi:Nif-specific regulatory protein
MTKRMRSADVELITIHEISQALHSSLELRQTLGTVVNVLSKNLGVSRAMVTLVTPSGDLELVASSGAMDDAFANDDCARGDGVVRHGQTSDAPAGTAAEAADELELFCLNRDQPRDDNPKRPMSLVGVPIRACGRDLGVLSCARQQGELPGSFQHDVRLLSIVASLIGEAVKLPASPAGEHDHPLQEAPRFH